MTTSIADNLNGRLVLKILMGFISTIENKPTNRLAQLIPSLAQLIPSSFLIFRQCTACLYTAMFVSKSHKKQVVEVPPVFKN
jgi:hypothetical protein